MRASTTHELKTWPTPFQAVWNEEKRHEIRKNDRDFQAWDRLHLREYNPESGAYTGRELGVTVTYITNGPAWDIPEGMCVMSVKLNWRKG